MQLKSVNCRIYFYDQTLSNYILDRYLLWIFTMGRRHYYALKTKIKTLQALVRLQLWSVVYFEFLQFGVWIVCVRLTFRSSTCSDRSDNGRSMIWAVHSMDSIPSISDRLSLIDYQIPLVEKLVNLFSNWYTVVVVHEQNFYMIYIPWLNTDTESSTSQWSLYFRHNRNLLDFQYLLKCLIWQPNLRNLKKSDFRPELRSLLT